MLFQDSSAQVIHVQDQKAFEVAQPLKLVPPQEDPFAQKKSTRIRISSKPKKQEPKKVLDRVESQKDFLDVLDLEDVTVK